MKTLLGVAGGVLVGWFAGAAVAEKFVRSTVDYEWARMLENGMVGPTQTRHPLRGA